MCYEWPRAQPLADDWLASSTPRIASSIEERAARTDADVSASFGPIRMHRVRKVDARPRFIDSPRCAEGAFAEGDTDAQMAAISPLGAEARPAARRYYSKDAMSGISRCFADKSGWHSTHLRWR